MRGVGSYSRGTRRLKGRGGYAEDIGGSIGSWLGQKAGSLFRSITGLGTYKVNRNSLVSAQASDPPVVSNTTSATRVQHREFIKDISGSQLFEIQTFEVNPGIATTFPWLASVASCFEEYRMHGILFEFKSTSADALNSTNTALGTVIMATEYNPLHPPFANKREMENYVYSTSNAPSMSALHPLECARDVTVLDELFVRNTPVVGSDLRFSDLGKFQLATVGMQANAVIGELWVTYDIELLKPKLPDSFVSLTPSHYSFNVGTPLLPNPQTYGPPTAANKFGSTVPGVSPTPKYAVRGIGSNLVTFDTNTIRFKSTGIHLFVFSYQGSAALCSLPGIVTGGDIDSYPMFANSGALSAVFESPFSGTNSTLYMYLYACNVRATDGPGSASLTFTGGILPASVTSSDILVVPLPNSFTVDKAESIEISMGNLLKDLQEKVKQLTLRICDDSEEDDYKEAAITPRPIEDYIHDDLSGSTADLVSRLHKKLMAA